MCRRGDVIKFFSLHNPRRLSLFRPRFLSPLATNCANIGPKRWRWNLEFCASEFSKNCRYVTSPEGGELTLETSASLSCYDHNLTLINFNVSQFSCLHFQWTFLPIDGHSALRMRRIEVSSQTFVGLLRTLRCLSTVGIFPWYYLTYTLRSTQNTLEGFKYWKRKLDDKSLHLLA